MRKKVHKSLLYFVLPIDNYLKILNKTEIIIYGMVRCSKKALYLTIEEYSNIIGSSKKTIINAISKLIKLNIVSNISNVSNKYILKCNDNLKLGNYNGIDTLNEEQKLLLLAFYNNIK